MPWQFLQFHNGSTCIYVRIILDTAYRRNNRRGSGIDEYLLAFQQERVRIRFHDNLIRGTKRSLSGIDRYGLPIIQILEILLTKQRGQFLLGEDRLLKLLRILLEGRRSAIPCHLSVMYKRFRRYTADIDTSTSVHTRRTLHHSYIPSMVGQIRRQGFSTFPKTNNNRIVLFHL